MVNVITQLFKYMVALIMAIYTIRCFTVFSVKKEKKKRRIGKSKAEKDLQEDIDKEVEALNEISHKEENK